MNYSAMRYQTKLRKKLIGVNVQVSLKKIQFSQIAVRLSERDCYLSIGDIAAPNEPVSECSSLNRIGSCRIFF